MRLKNLVIIICFILIFVSSPVSHYQYIHAIDTELSIILSHGGKGNIELCVESSGYEDQCDDFDLSVYQNPLRYILDVEDPDQGQDFRVCYEVKETESEGCRNFEFNGLARQTVNIEIPDIELPATDGGRPISDEDFSLQDTDGSLSSPQPSSDTPGPATQTVPELPPVPVIPP